MATGSSAAAVSNATRFCAEFKRQAIGDTTAVDLHQAARLAADFRTTVSTPATGILYHHFARIPFDHEPLTGGSGMAPLEQGLYLSDPALVLIAVAQ